MIKLLPTRLIYKSSFKQVLKLINGGELMEVSKLWDILGDSTGEFNVRVEYFLVQFIKPLEVFDNNSNVGGAILLFKISPGFKTVCGFVNDREAAFIDMTSNQVDSFSILYFPVLVELPFFLLIIVLTSDLFICRTLTISIQRQLRSETTLREIWFGFWPWWTRLFAIHYIDGVFGSERSLEIATPYLIVDGASKFRV